MTELSLAQIRKSWRLVANSRIFGRVPCLAEMY
jgi:hypothetical protein